MRFATLLTRLFKRPAAVPPRREAGSGITLTRRELAGTATALLPLALAGNPVEAAAPLDPAVRDALLRGLALAPQRGDPVGAAAAARLLDDLAETDAEGALLCRLYRRLDTLPAYWPADAPAADPATLALLHGAVERSEPVAFGYTDLSDRQTTRTVLPLALVHPPHGVKLLAWCCDAEGFRQFFVRAMRDVSLQPGSFAEERLALLEELVEKEGA